MDSSILNEEEAVLEPIRQAHERILLFNNPKSRVTDTDIYFLDIFKVFYHF